VAAVIISNDCFHNVAGNVEPQAGTPRAGICDAVAGHPHWELIFIGAAAAVGAAVQLLPLARKVRWVLCAIVAVGVFVTAVIVGSLDYTNNI
jgi:hypothetical protein